MNEIDFLPIKLLITLNFTSATPSKSSLFLQARHGLRQRRLQRIRAGNRETASYVMEQGRIRFVLTTPLGPDQRIARQVHLHGDGVGVVALEVPDAESAYHETIKRGATGAIKPTEMADEYGVLRYSAIQAYGDTLIKFVDRSGYRTACCAWLSASGRCAAIR
ncbi:MAG: VOC family protein [Anaerolineae bacterium]